MRLESFKLNHYPRWYFPVWPNLSIVWAEPPVQPGVSPFTTFERCAVVTSQAATTPTSVGAPLFSEVLREVELRRQTRGDQEVPVPGDFMRFR
jgi:hypothetical protein